MHQPTSTSVGWRRSGAAALVFVGLFGQQALSADLPRPDEATDFLAPDRLAAAHPRWTLAHRPEAAIAGDLLVWPAVTFGAVFDTNPYQQHRAHRTAAGFALGPQLLVERDAGLHRTDIYASGDLRIYPDARGADVGNGRAGVLHDWSLRPDLAVRLQGEVDRRTDPFESTQLVTAGAARGLIAETDALAAASVQKMFDRVFVNLSGTALRADFTAARTGTASDLTGLSGETIGTLRARVGYLFPSSLYAFAEPSADWRALDRVTPVSSGTRAVAGVGIAQFGLLGGEVFAGRQEQDYPTQGSHEQVPVIGGRVAWSATRMWSVAAQFDTSLGQVAVGTVADPIGTPTQSHTALATIGFTPSPVLTAHADAGLVLIDYAGTRRSDTLTFADLRIDYALSRSFDLTSLLRVAALDSSVPLAAYTRATATLAASYHY